MNQNEAAVEVAKREGKRKAVNIAQIKEVMKHYNNIIKEKTGVDIARALSNVG